MNEKLIVQMDSKKTRICNTKVRKSAARAYLILSMKFILNLHLTVPVQEFISSIYSGLHWRRSLCL